VECDGIRQCMERMDMGVMMGVGEGGNQMMAELER
jgi:hypothetical protein